MTLVFQRVVLPQTMWVERGLKVDPMGRLFEKGGPSTCLLLRLLRWLSAVWLVFSTEIPRLHKSLSNSGGHRSWGQLVHLT
jgi:hypothetical protein